MIHKTLHKKWRNMNPLKDMGDLWCSRRVKSSCSLSGNRHVCLLKNITINLIIERSVTVIDKNNNTKNIIIETNVTVIDKTNITMNIIIETSVIVIDNK